MNAISVTMVKGTSAHFLQEFAFRAVAGIVTLSWTGLQLLLVSGAFQKQQATNHAIIALLGGLALLFYSFFLFLRLRRMEATPSRESAQLYFGAFLVALPFLTWMMWFLLDRLLFYNRHLVRHDTAGRALVYACVIVSVAYFVTILIWLQTNVSAYDLAKPGTWSNRLMNWLQSSVLKPYFK